MYQAIVCKIHTRPHPNADRLLLGDAHGYQVVVGKDTQDGELGIFFGADGQLSPEFCNAHDLIGYTDESTGEKRGGFFGKNRRVRAQSFRGEKSDGFWCPISYLDFCGIYTKHLQEGYTFDTYNGIPICNKYFTPATLKAQNKGKNLIQRQNKYFAKHMDTEQLRHVEKLPDDAIVYFTEKLHGTSGRYGYVLDEKIPRKRFWHRIIKPVPKPQYKPLLGTRNVVLADPNHVGSWYGSEQFRFNAIKPIEGLLHKGEIIYFELVGFTTSGTAIMNPHDVTKMKDKAVEKEFGKQIIYSYGNKPDQCSLHVYRITKVDEDGEVVEYSWPQVKSRCKQLNIQYVPYLGMNISNHPKIEFIKKAAEHLADGKSTLDDHIREGVVLRVESSEGTEFYKYKGFTFSVLEGIIKESDDYVDTEEVS